MRGVRTLLHDNGYTIKGVQRLHKEHGVRHLVEAAAAKPIEIEGAVETPQLSAPRRSILGVQARIRLTDVLDDLEATKARLDALLAHDD